MEGLSDGCLEGGWLGDTEGGQLGNKVGNNEGEREGEREGAVLGVAEGTYVGCVEGCREGLRDGEEEEGIRLGLAEGVSEGERLTNRVGGMRRGAPEGKRVGCVVGYGGGDSDGARDGDRDGSVGEDDGAPVGDEVVGDAEGDREGLPLGCVEGGEEGDIEGKGVGNVGVAVVVLGRLEGIADGADENSRGASTDGQSDGHWKLRAVPRSTSRPRQTSLPPVHASRQSPEPQRSEDGLHALSPSQNSITSVAWSPITVSLSQAALPLHVTRHGRFGTQWMLRFTQAPSPLQLTVCVAQRDTYITYKSRIGNHAMLCARARYL